MGAGIEQATREVIVGAAERPRDKAVGVSLS